MNRKTEFEDEYIQNSIHSNEYSHLNTKHQNLKRKPLHKECQSQLSYNSTTKIDSQTQTEDNFYLINYGDPSLLPKPKKVKRVQTPEEHINHLDTLIGEKIPNNTQPLPLGPSFFDLIERLTKSDVRTLQNAIDFPAGLSDKYSTPEEFLLYIDIWEDFDPENFLTALSYVRNDLVCLAKDVPFLTQNTKQMEELDENRIIMKEFVSKLKTELTITRWRVILKILGYNADEDITYSDILAFCLKKYFIPKKFNILTECFKNIKREDLALKMVNYGHNFSKMNIADFEATFKNVAFSVKEEFPTDVEDKFNLIVYKQ